MALFEASRYLQNENVENEAFKLLQEAIIFNPGDLSFENGLSGIGYIVMCLIDKNFIEADFDEIFGEQYEKIVKSIVDVEKKPEMLLNSMKVIYFLSKAACIKPKDERLSRTKQKIFEGLELFLTLQFQDFSDIHCINDKMAVLRIYEVYLKLVNFAGYKHFSHVLLENYAVLYQTGRVLSSLAIGYELDILVRRNSIAGYDDIVNEQIADGTRNIHFAHLSLKEKIDVAKLLSDMEHNGIALQNQDGMLRNLFKEINIKASPLDYYTGLARLVILCVNRQTELL